MSICIGRATERIAKGEPVCIDEKTGNATVYRDAPDYKGERDCSTLDSIMETIAEWPIEQANSLNLGLAPASMMSNEIFRLREEVEAMEEVKASSGDYEWTGSRWKRGG